jgi:hypothetical protein
MIEIEKNENGRQQDFLLAVALCLVVAVTLLIVAAVLNASTFSNLSARNWLEFVTQSGANVVTAGLVLAAVVALSRLTPEHAARARPILVGALLIGGVIVVLTVFSVFDFLTVHIPSPNSQDTFSLAFTHGDSVSGRLAAMLPSVAAMFIALVALVGANRLGSFVTSGSRGSGGSPPG